MQSVFRFWVLSWHEGSSSIKYLSKIRVLLLIKVLFYKNSSYACLRILLSCPCLKSKETIIVLLAAIWLLDNSNPASELGFEHLDSSCVFAGTRTPGQPEPTAAEGSRNPGGCWKRNLQIALGIQLHFWPCSAIIMGFLGSCYIHRVGIWYPFCYPR